MLTDFVDLCVASEVCVSWNKAALAPECWRDVTAIDVQTRRRLYSNISSSDDFSHDGFVSVPHGTRCIQCALQAPWKLIHKRRRKRQRVDCKHKFGVKGAVDVITTRSRNRLRSLDLHNCCAYHHLSEYQMHDSDLTVIAERCSRSLRYFTISPSVHLRANALVGFAYSCSQLRKLHMPDCQELSINHLRHIVHACPHLEDISVSRCPRFKGQALMMVLHPLRNTLRRLDISFTPCETIDLPFAMTFPVLEEIVADHCSSLTGSIPVYDPHSSDPRKWSTSNLKTLRLNDTLFDNDIFASLFRRCPHLQCISTNHLPPSSMRPLDAAFSFCVPPLRTLCVAAIPISDATWIRIYETLRTTLKFCDVSNNRKLTLDVALDKGNFENLEGIYIRNCAPNDRALANFLLHTPRLDIIDVTGCHNVVSRPFQRDPLYFRPVMHRIAAGESLQFLEQ